MNTPSAVRIFIVSGGLGASAEQVVYTVLAQFPSQNVTVKTTGHVREADQIDQVLKHARETSGLVVHTLVDERLRAHLIRQAKQMNVPVFDLMGPLIDWLSQVLGQPPLQQPGLYRKLHREYFDRVEAIDFTLAHDDGKNPDGWKQAEIVLVGPSRVGKTPLSLYLAVLGWKVANIPLVPQISVADEIHSLDTRRVIGLTIDAGQLIQLRLQRQLRLGVSGLSAYIDPDEVNQEIQEAVKFYRRCGFTQLDMTDKTIELAADEILRRFGDRSP